MNIVVTSKKHYFSTKVRSSTSAKVQFHIQNVEAKSESNKLKHTKRREYILQQHVNSKIGNSTKNKVIKQTRKKQTYRNE